MARELKRRWPDAELLGTGGAHMAASGVELLAGLDELAVMGVVEVVTSLPRLYRLERRLRGRLDAGGVDLVIPIDYPGFNLRIARYAHDRGVPVLYYIAPKFWAWGAGRGRRLARDTDRVAAILPFEVPLLEAEGADAVYVGNPLLDRDADIVDEAAFREAHELDGGPFLALFPGSRRQELDRHLNLFLEVARRIGRERPGAQPVLARASSVSSTLLAGHGVPVVDETRALLRHARAALLKSGTTTLEAALEGVPSVITYKAHPVTAWLARRLVQVEYSGLPNLIAGREIMPEILLDRATPEALTRALLELWDEGEPRERMIADLRGVRGALGEPGAARSVARLAAELLESHPEGPAGGRW